jgi:glycosyltransferase involved in cell wall biosynthesis
MVMEDSVSVIVPCYNAEHYLENALDSIRSQACPDLEIIVVDDGSTDDTAGVLRKLNGTDLQVLRQDNTGPAAARNLGISAARGKWIAFLDADDYWLPSKLNLQLESLARKPDAAFCYSSGIYIGPPNTRRIQKPHRSGEDVFWSLLWGSQLLMGSVIVRRECFAQAGSFDTQLRTGEDWDMWLRLAARWTSCYVKEPLVVCRASEQKNKYSSELLEQCTMRVINRLFSRRDWEKKLPELDGYRRELFAWHFSVLAKSHLRQKRYLPFLKLALAAMYTHPKGIYFLAHRWSRSGKFPYQTHAPSKSGLAPASNNV